MLQYMAPDPFMTYGGHNDQVMRKMVKIKISYTIVSKTLKIKPHFVEL